MKALRDLNHQAETKYSEFLKQASGSEDKRKQDFLGYLSHEYNKILESWLPDEKFANYQPIEPLIPLEKLPTFKEIDDCNNQTAVPN